MAGGEQNNILNCIRTLATNFPCGFILVGGASMIKLHSQRATNDIDILVPSLTNVHELIRQLAGHSEFRLVDGVVYINPPSESSSLLSYRRPLKLDILTQILGIPFDDFISHVATTDGITMLTLPVSLGVKLGCWHSRAEDENGESKKQSDLEDIVFLAKLMRAKGILIGDDIPAALKISHYNLLLIRLSLMAADVQLLREVGCSKFLKNYDDNTADQREYYELMGAEADTDPLTVELEDEEELEVLWASEMGSIESVEVLLSAGADPNDVEYDGWSALHWAATNGHDQVVELLLRAGAKAKLKDSQGLLPIDWAVRRENWAVVAIFQRQSSSITENASDELAGGDTQPTFQPIKPLKEEGLGQ
ncbi:hypothetical protein GP486_005500 [Trichoglossum hirsutum]|uniref:Ankyrin n=1 Tax=Trichoglossum hirsutum TaxID=265104 RepID=A0A9P8L9B4_9PEZI|nr:hypothetical protein GP486_005500 [Trichoglossum hirsutum]